MRTLYLKLTTYDEIYKKWGIKCLRSLRLIQCTKEGLVNWNKASLYSDSEVVDLLIKGRPVVILK